MSVRQHVGRAKGATHRAKLARHRAKALHRKKAKKGARKTRIQKH